MLKPTIVLLLSLVVALSAGAPAARAGDHVTTDDYAALGDSYSSGVGTFEPSDGLDACQRRPGGFPNLLARESWPRPTRVHFVDATCSGAVTRDVLEGQLGALKPPSTAPGSDPLGTNYVTLSIGGNDAGFAPVIAQCARPWPFSCRRDVERAQRFIRADLPARLREVYAAIRAQVPHAYVIVAGYSRLFAERKCPDALHISVGEQRRLNETADLLRDVTETEVADAGPGFEFVDPIPAFTGHAVCVGPEAWLNGISPVRPLESFHPNRAGYRDGYLPLVREAVRVSP